MIIKKMAKKSEEKLTPMMQQYLSIKNKYKDSILFYRLGDFYEMFLEDAITASKELNLTLTKKPVGKGKKVPLAGIPYHAYEGYLTKLIKKGYKVAICEQIEDPKKTKGLVKRDVIRVVTPGTVLSDNLLEDKEYNYLCSFNLDEKTNKIGLSFLELSTGKFLITEFKDDEKFNKLFTELDKFGPAECIVSETFAKNQLVADFFRLNQIVVNEYEDWNFDLISSTQKLLDFFQISTLEGFGLIGLDLAVGCAGVITDYVSETQKIKPTHINNIQYYNTNEFLTLDSDTQRNLELTKTLRGETNEGTLFSVLDNSILGSGSRLLKDWILNPLTNKDKILYRQNGVKEFFENLILRNSMRDKLENIYDIERIVSKISCKTVSPRDLVSLKTTLKLLPDLKEIIKNVNSEILNKIYDDFDLCQDIFKIIDDSISENPPVILSDGNIIKKGYNSEIDELRKIKYEGKQYLLELEQREKERTNISSLKIKFNKVFGYYIDITNTHLDKVPDNYIRKQTLVNSERYITPELKEFEEKVVTADGKLNIIEEKLFNEIRDKINKEVKRLQKVSQLIALLDVLSGLAEIALLNNYKCPKINDSVEIYLKNSRHPVIEKIMQTEKFISNDIYLHNEKERLQIITGPNMAGKSTYIRQVALNVLIAQIGSYVPAEEAKIGIVDRIFTRVGASDNLVKGQSTFMVEMIEASNILNNATSKSLIILDEIGRGTSTFDGLSLAWSIAEYIVNHIGAKTLFATHYHELTELVEVYSNIKNYNIAVREWNDNIVFLRKILPGGTSKSYGIQVARLAGLPKIVIDRSKEILYSLENNQSPVKKRDNHLVDLFADDFLEKIETEKVKTIPDNEHIINELDELDINDITPMQALNLIFKLKKEIKK